MRIVTAACVLAALVAVVGRVRGDHEPTQISWKGWRVASTEELWEGAKHTSYPLTHLFDGDFKTAWVFSGKKSRTINASRYAVALDPETPVQLTSVRIRNGYHRSPALYAKNSRASRIRLTINGEDNLVWQSCLHTPLVKNYDLTDTMQWQVLSFPRTLVHCLMIDITRIRAGATDDLCISEIELRDGEQKVDLAMPAAVLFTRGSECGCGSTYELIDRDGKRIVRDDGQERSEGLGSYSVWSGTGRYVAGVECGRKGAASFWMVDGRTGTVVARRPFDQGAIAEITWRGDREARLEWDVSGEREAQFGRAHPKPVVQPKPIILRVPAAAPVRQQNSTAKKRPAS